VHLTIYVCLFFVGLTNSTPVDAGLFSLLAVMTSFGRRVDGLDNRSGTVITLLLTASTYRIAITNRQPPISYLTTLDYCSTAPH
jgi:hypothetical protein